MCVRARVGYEWVCRVWRRGVTCAFPTAPGKARLQAEESVRKCLFILDPTGGPRKKAVL